MDELTLIKEFFGVGGAVCFAMVFGVVFAVRKTAIDEVKERLTRVEADVQWIRSALEKLEGSK